MDQEKKTLGECMEQSGRPTDQDGSQVTSQVPPSSQTTTRSLRYSGLKALKYPHIIEAIREGEAPFGYARKPGPVHIQMILSDLCNQDCAFCAYRDPGYTSSQLFHVDGDYNPKRFLPFDKVLEILDDCAWMGVKAIQLTGGGEPLVYPKFDKVVAAILERGMKWALVTNGVLAERHDLSTAIWIRVSVDAGTRESYAKIRRCPPNHWEKAWKTVAKHKAGVGYVVTPDNWMEIFQCAEIAHDVGASNMRIGAQFSSEGEDLFAGIREKAQVIAHMAADLSDDHFEVFNKFEEKLDDLGQGRPDYRRCGYQRFTTYIGADQNLYRCCLYAYSPRGKIARLEGRRFREVWKEVAYPDFEKFDARGCVRCQYNRINRAINEVVDYDESEAFV